MLKWNLTTKLEGHYSKNKKTTTIIIIKKTKKNKISIKKGILNNVKLVHKLQRLCMPLQLNTTE